MTTTNESRPGGNRAANKSFAGDTITVPDVPAVLAAVDRNADGWWRSCAMAGVEYLASTGVPFTAHDVAALGVPDPDVPARWGALMSAARAEGTIVLVGIVPSSRPTVHRALVRLWIGAHGGAVR